MKCTTAASWTEILAKKHKPVTAARSDDSHAARLAPMADSQRQSTRRRFLGLSVGIAAASTCSCALFATKRKPDLVLGPVEGALIIPVARFSDLAGPRSSVLLLNKASSEKILVVRDASGGYSAVSSTCTHLSCDVGYAAAVGRIVCPCHGSEYDLQGRNLKGPARRPLRRYTVRVQTDRIVVET